MSVFDSIFRKKTGLQAPAIHEAMFSGVFKLSKNPEEVLLRIHPTKRRAYDAIISGNATVEQNGKEVKVADVLLNLNGAAGTVQISYKSLANVDVRIVKDTFFVNGFDTSGEPIIYGMHDGTIRVVFSSIPPTSTGAQNAFDISEFSKAFIAAVQCGAVHDDREVFHVPRPGSNTVRDITSFLESYRGR